MRGSRDQNQKFISNTSSKSMRKKFGNGFMNSDATIYLSGNNKLPGEIRKALAKVAESNGSIGWTCVCQGIGEGTKVSA